MSGKPSMDQWLREAKEHPDARKAGMYLFHNGVVRETTRAAVRGGAAGEPAVKAMAFTYDPDRLEAVIAAARRQPGIYYIRAWLNSGFLKTGDDIMFVLVGGDTRPHVTAALDYLVGRIKTECVTEEEITE